MAQSNSTVRLIEVELPDFGVPETRPELSKAIHADRFRAASSSARATPV